MPPGADLRTPAGPDHVRVSACPFALSTERRTAIVPHGLTVEEILRQQGLGELLQPGLNVLVTIETAESVLEAARADWGRIIPRPGETVGVRAVPTGGGGGGKDPLRAVLMVAVVVAAIAVPALATSLVPTLSAVPAPLLSGATLALGSVLTNALVPPQTPTFSMPKGIGGLEEASPTYGISGTRNAARPYGVVPHIFGRVTKYRPPLAASPYSELAGDDLYYRYILTPGAGPLKISDIRIGDTPIGRFKDVDIEIREGRPDDAPVKLYSKDIHEESLGILLEKSSGWVTRTSADEADELIWDLNLPQGLYRLAMQDDDDWNELKSRHDGLQPGDAVPETVALRCEYRREGSSGWTSFPGVGSLTKKTRTPVRRSFRVKVPRGRYEVRWLRSTADDTTGFRMNRTTVTCLRSVTSRHPVQPDGMPPLAFIALRIRASGQLNGIIDQLNCTVERYHQIHDGNGWTEARVRNAAWAYVDALRGPWSRRPVPEDRLDLEAFREWAALCDERGWEFNAAIDYRTTLWEVLRLIGPIGRGAFCMRDNLFSVAVERADALPVQTFSPRNSWNYRGTRDHGDLPHGVKVRFRDATSGQTDEVRVYRDGFDGGNATNMPVLDAFGVDSPQQAARQGRFHLLDLTLRQETHSFDTGMGYLRCTLGDTVNLVHDVPMFGIGAGRIVSVTTDGEGRGLCVDVDEDFPRESGRTYGLTVCLFDGTQHTVQVSPDYASRLRWHFRDPVPAPVCPQGGEHAAFGEAGRETVRHVVTRIDPGEEFTARLTVRLFVPELHSRDAADCDFQWNPNITRPPAMEPPTPEAPVIREMLSDETQIVRRADGSLESRIRVLFDPAGGTVAATAFHPQFRPEGGEWEELPALSADARSFMIPDVEDGGRYELRLRAEAFGVTSDWASAMHTVTGKTSPPPDIAAAFLEGDRLVWAYPDPPLDHDGFAVRYHESASRHWDSAVRPPDGRTRDLSYDVSRFSGRMTFLVRAVDTTGNLSAGTAVVTGDFGPSGPVNLIETFPMAPDFPGTLASGEPADGALQGRELTSFWPPDDHDALWQAPASGTFWAESTYTRVEYSFTWVPCSTLTGDALLVETDSGSCPVQISYRPDCALPFWGADESPFWTADAPAFWSERPPWRPWPGRLPGLTLQEYAFRATMPGGNRRPRLSGLNLVVDAEDLTEYLEDFPLPPEGARLPLTNRYRRIRQVRPVLQYTQGGATRLAVMDKDPDGPFLRAFAEDGTPRAAAVDVEVLGY